MHRSLQIYIERTCGKTQSAALGRGTPVIIVSLSQKLYLFLNWLSVLLHFGLRLDFSRLLLKLGSPKLHTTYLT